jgi:hypothetical protein
MEIQINNHEASVYLVTVRRGSQKAAWYMQIPWGRSGEPVLRTDDDLAAIKAGKAAWYAVNGSAQVSEISSAMAAANSLTRGSEQTVEVADA